MDTLSDSFLKADELELQLNYQNFKIEATKQYDNENKLIQSSLMS